MDAFHKVDESVAKPVLGSDGAARWQEFDKSTSSTKKSSSSAPMAPLKAADRAAGGLSHWHEERQREDANRQAQGLTSLREKQGYTHFKQGPNNDEQDESGLTAKQRKRITNKVRPDEVEYFLPHKTFVGWKWDYVFTTRPNYGTGYYWDGTDSLLELQGKRTRPTAATTNDDAAATKKRKGKDRNDANKEEGEAATKPKKKKTKKHANQSAVVDIPTDASHPLEQVAAALNKHQSNDLPAGWHAAKDPFTGKTYYYNGSTQERTWEKPTTTTTTLSSELSPPLPSGWTVAKDTTSGKDYYYHAETQKTQWERPVS